ncbi:uncharacterized protein ACA1_230510 [Acanthamoeba castellanii str. Neff]|uniref:Uncharacterized protein n=1 Tax=Acanthamoeba castellanii (strain ATCC 30010 / Neff) TaxID=1257118 RepID=L8H925_ACACF|nr:uncharacterized protein ACA1_230510 [Acanthamoeba castellanii str. Neff]ELR21665.1 hypothetical protein ACA1_230510 [Acanthamoeba castellanii str. Neff]
MSVQTRQKAPTQASGPAFIQKKKTKKKLKQQQAPTTLLRLDWDPALALAGTSRAARDTVLAYHPVTRVVLLELVPLVASAVASVSLQPQAAFAHCDDYIDRRDLRAALALPEESTQPGGPAVEAGDQLDLATKAEVLLDALIQQVSARKHQLHIEQLYWKSLYTGDQVHAVKRVVQENIVVRSYAEREVTTDQAITCILEVKVPTPDATGGHDVFILNIMYWVLGLPTNEYGQRKDRIVRTQAFCRRAGDTTAEPALLFGMATFFVVCGTTKRPPTLPETGHYREDLHLFSEEPLLAPPSIRLDFNHPSCSWEFLTRLTYWVSAWRYQLKLPRAYIVAALKKPESVATISDVERVLPHILRGTGECSRMQIIEASVSCYAKVHLAVPGAKGHLVLIVKLSSQEGGIADRSLLELGAHASTKSLGKRFGLGLDDDPCAWSPVLGGSVRDGRDVVWGLKFLDEVARTYGLPAGESDMVDPEEAHASEAIRIGAILFVCALAAAPQYDVIKEGAATLMLGVDGPSVPFGFRMLPFGRSFLSVPVEESVAHDVHCRFTAVVEGMAKTFGVLAMPGNGDAYEYLDDDDDDLDDSDEDEDDEDDAE